MSDPDDDVTRFAEDDDPEQFIGEELADDETDHEGVAL